MKRNLYHTPSSGEPVAKRARPNRPEANPFHDLPDELLSYILLRAPPVLLLKLARVCQQWFRVANALVHRLVVVPLPPRLRCDTLNTTMRTYHPKAAASLSFSLNDLAMRWPRIQSLVLNNAPVLVNRFTETNRLEPLRESERQEHDMPSELFAYLYEDHEGMQNTWTTSCATFATAPAAHNQVRWLYHTIHLFGSCWATSLRHLCLGYIVVPDWTWLVRLQNLEELSLTRLGTFTLDQLPLVGMPWRLGLRAFYGQGLHGMTLEALDFFLSALKSLQRLSLVDIPVLPSARTQKEAARRLTGLLDPGAQPIQNVPPEKKKSHAKITQLCVSSRFHVDVSLFSRWLFPQLQHLTWTSTCAPLPIPVADVGHYTNVTRLFLVAVDDWLGDATHCSTLSYVFPNVRELAIALGDEMVLLGPILSRLLVCARARDAGWSHLTNVTVFSPLNARDTIPEQLLEWILAEPAIPPFAVSLQKPTVRSVCPWL